MRRGSIIGPVILIMIGGLFLLHNVVPNMPVLQFVADWWPLLLMVWGLIRFVEILVWNSQGKPLPSSGISGGEWFLAILITLAGSALFVGHKYSDKFSRVRVSSRGLDLFGESFDFPVNGGFKAGKTPRIQIENGRGNSRVVGADVEEIKVTGRNQVRAFNYNDAENVNSQAPFEIVQQGDLLVIRTNQDRIAGPTRLTSDLEITVPRASSVLGRGRHGDFDVSGITGNVDIDSDNAGVRLSSIGGNVRVDLRRSDLIRAAGVKGNVEVKGGGDDLEIEGVEGTVAVNGNYHGDLSFRKLGKTLRFESDRTELRVERLPGVLQFNRGHFTAEDFGGGFFLRTGSRDVRLSAYDGAVEVEVDKGDIELRPGRVPVGATTLRSEGGQVHVVLPDNAQFEVNAELRKGEIENDFGSVLIQEEEDKGARLTGNVGRGATIKINLERGSISLRKSSAAPPRSPSAPNAPLAPAAPKAANLPVTQQ